MASEQKFCGSILLLCLPIDKTVLDEARGGAATQTVNACALCQNDRILRNSADVKCGYGLKIRWSQAMFLAYRSLPSRTSQNGMISHRTRATWDRGVYVRFIGELRRFSG